MSKWFFLLTTLIALAGLTLMRAQPPAPPASPGMKQALQCSPNTHLNAQAMPDMNCSSIDIVLRHERYTVTMFRQVLKQATQPEFKTLLQQMIKTHEQEIETLNNLRRTWYGQPLAPSR